MKKISSIILLTVFALALFCSCTPKDAEGASSAVAESDIVFSSTVETSSVSTESEQEEDKSSSSKKEESSSSEKEPSSSSKEESSSSKPSITIQRPGSQSNSQGIKVAPADRNCVIISGLTTSTANSYGNTTADAMREIEDVMASGYFNSMCCAKSLLRNTDFWELVEKYNFTVWYDASSIFNSSSTDLNGYIEALYNTVDKYIKPFPERWERFNGFWYNEKIRHGESNDDFIAETEAVYKKYGKRTYASIVTAEFSSIEGDYSSAATKEMNKMKGNAFNYVTDVGFSSYGIDVRDGADNDNLSEKYRDIMPGIVDAKSYFTECARELLMLVDHPVNLWFLPCAYNGPVKGGLDGLKTADEEFCLAQLNFFYDELSNYDYTGGLMLYTYALFSSKENAGTRGLKYYLAIEGDEGYKIHPETEKWERYSKRLKEIVNNYNSQEASIVIKVR
ncbi:MAG: hypothetical protein UHH95_02635 [Oscillospiraceae bacterium]|nr:hypothetical protein [Oscillospiraceae bacterium]